MNAEKNFRMLDLNKAVAITVNDFVKSFNVVYKEERKFLWIVISEAGFYRDVIGNLSFLGKNFDEEVNSRPYQVFKDNAVYNKPKVLINFINGSTFEKYFETYEEALEFSTVVKNSVKDASWLQ